MSLEDAAAIEADSWETTKILVEAFEEGNEGNDAGRGDSASDIFRADTENDVLREISANDILREESADDVPPAKPTENTARAARMEPAVPKAEEPGDAADGWPAVLEPYRDFLKAALTADKTAQKQAATALRKMPDAVADEINTLTADPDLEGNPICDIILEDNGTGTYTLIEDYLPDLSPLL